MIVPITVPYSDAYVRNNPVNLLDLLGLAWTDWQEVIASLEGTVDEADLNDRTSYGLDPNIDLFVALPSEGLRGKEIDIEVNGLTIRVPVGDVGPWNGGHFKSGKSINDPYWENNQQPQAECGTDLRKRRTNRAGIDISHALAERLGLQGNVRVRWRGRP